MSPAIALPSRPSAPKAIPAAARMVAKRDGTSVKFDLNRIMRAVALAFFDHENPGVANPAKDDMLACYGLSADTYLKVTEIAAKVIRMLEFYYKRGVHPTIEEVQDTVGKAIAEAGEWDVAQSFVFYRATRAARRLNAYPENGMFSYLAISKYARHSETLGRRETFVEGVERVKEMHKAKFQDRGASLMELGGDEEAVLLAGENWKLVEERFAGKTLNELIDDVFERVARKEVLPSMRSMQFGGTATLRNHARIYNCAFSNVDRYAFFREYLFLLLSGCGAGFSVQKHHVAMLEALPVRTEKARRTVKHFLIPDTIEGWADSMDELFKSFLGGYHVEFNFSAIRPEGSPLKTSGGKAPGHLPLKEALEHVTRILNGASGRGLRPIEVYDICMFIAQAVLAGGIRRSATIALFSPDDDEMINAKALRGDPEKDKQWWDTDPQRKCSNNSAVLSRNADNEKLFRRLFEVQKKYGEPGFYFCDNPDAGANPCVEIGLHPVLTKLTHEDVEKLYSYGYTGEFPETSRLSGWQMCNLSTISAAAIKTALDFLHACITAAFIGTLQASYTVIKYLGAVTRMINEKDALLGVSICGFMDNPEILFNPELLAAGAHLVRAVNRLVARAIGINPASRTTCVKPEGTASLILGTSDGIHTHWDSHYFRRVTANQIDPIYMHFKKTNPQMTEVSQNKPNRDDFIVFPVTAPKNAILKRDVNALQMLSYVRLVQQAWVSEGTASHNRSPEVRHNVSNTITCKLEEYGPLADAIWADRHLFTGIALFADEGDKVYTQPPKESVDLNNDVHIARWNALQPKPVDYTTLAEQEDNTSHQLNPACMGGSCELK